MARSYRQLSLEDRVTLQTQLQMGWSPAAIAAGLQRARSTVTREMAHNGWKPASTATAQSRRWGNGMHLARIADHGARHLHQKPRVVRKLVPGTGLWPIVLKLLRRKRPQCGARSPERHQRAFLDALTLIDQRPEEVDQRIVPGHREGDLIKGAMNRSRGHPGRAHNPLRRPGQARGRTRPDHRPGLQ